MERSASHPNSIRNCRSQLLGIRTDEYQFSKTEKDKRMTATENALVISVADLTRSCCANENYFRWLSLHADRLKDSTEIANYLGIAAEVFEHQARAQRKHVDELAARDQLAGILMSSAPLSVEELQAAVTQCVRESYFTEAA
jgi:hypothetical protein